MFDFLANKQQKENDISANKFFSFILNHSHPQIYKKNNKS